MNSTYINRTITNIENIKNMNNNVINNANKNTH